MTFDDYVYGQGIGSYTARLSKDKASSVQGLFLCVGYNILPCYSLIEPCLLYYWK